MKRFRKRQRIFILALLCFSVCAPIVLVSHRLKSLALEGTKDFVEDLSSIKQKADTLRLSAIKQENVEGLKEPKQEVYRDESFSKINDDGLDATRTDNDGVGIANSGRKGTRYAFEQENVKLKRKKAPSRRSRRKKAQSSRAKGQQFDAGTSQHGQSFVSESTSGNKDNHGSQLQKGRAADGIIKEIRDQIVRAAAYLSFATTRGNTQLAKELRQRIKEGERALRVTSRDSDLSKRMRNLEVALSKASQLYPDCSEMEEKLIEMALRSEDKIQAQRKHTTFLTQLAGRTTPKGLHCLSMRLTAEYFALPLEKREPADQLDFYNPYLFHYVVFSDNVLACAVVVKSTVSAAEEPEKIVFHVVTDSLNFPGISMWFLLNPPRKASIQVQSIDHFKWLSSKYGPTMAPNTHKDDPIDPRHSSPLNHLRFYLPELFPNLDKIVLLDHDVVIRKDLSALWRVDMDGKVNGAVQTCQQGEPYHRRMDMLLNFSDPWVLENFDGSSCTRAFGMNLFDLKEWRKQGLSARYHRYLLMSSTRPIWKNKSLALGWATFYNQTVPLDSSWHVRGLGHNSNVSQESIEQAAVLHFDGNMKPWLDIRIRRYKSYWTNHINFDHPYLQQCNIHGYRNRLFFGAYVSYALFGSRLLESGQDEESKWTLFWFPSRLDS